MIGYCTAFTEHEAEKYQLNLRQSGVPSKKWLADAGDHQNGSTIWIRQRHEEDFLIKKRCLSHDSLVISPMSHGFSHDL